MKNSSSATVRGIQITCSSCGQVFSSGYLFRNHLSACASKCRQMQNYERKVRPLMAPADMPRRFPLRAPIFHSPTNAGNTRLTRYFGGSKTVSMSAAPIMHSVTSSQFRPGPIAVLSSSRKPDNTQPKRNVASRSYNVDLN
jgi:hypothetical protein